MTETKQERQQRQAVDSAAARFLTGMTLVFGWAGLAVGLLAVYVSAAWDSPEKAAKHRWGPQEWKNWLDADREARDAYREALREWLDSDRSKPRPVDYDPLTHKLRRGWYRTALLALNLHKAHVRGKDAARQRIADARRRRANGDRRWWYRRPDDGDGGQRTPGDPAPEEPGGGGQDPLDVEFWEDPPAAEEPPSAKGIAPGRSEEARRQDRDVWVDSIRAGLNRSTGEQEQAGDRIKTGGDNAMTTDLTRTPTATAPRPAPAAGPMVATGGSNIAPRTGGGESNAQVNGHAIESMRSHTHELKQKVDGVADAAEKLTLAAMISHRLSTDGYLTSVEREVSEELARVSMELMEAAAAAQATLLRSADMLDQMSTQNRKLQDGQKGIEDLGAEGVGVSRIASLG